MQKHVMLREEGTFGGNRGSDGAFDLLSERLPIGCKRLNGLQSPDDQELQAEVKEMGGMGQVIFDMGYERGIELGRAQGILAMGLSAKLSTEEIADELVRQLQWTREKAMAYVGDEGKSEQAPV